MARLYIIGDRETGVLFVKTEPLMVTHISKATIQSYATANGGTFDSVFARIASGAKSIVNKTEVSRSFADVETSYDAIGQLIGKGATLSDAEFCFVADIDATDWASHRMTVAPLATALANIAAPASPADHVQLREAPLD